MKKLIGIALVLFLLLVACSKQLDETNADKQTAEARKNELILAIGSEPEDGFDPTLGWGRYGNPLFQSTLFTYDADFQIKYDLAESYEVSRDGLEWTIKIRQDVLFADGELLDAKDVVFTFNKTKNSASVVDLNNMKKIEAKDEFTIQITLQEPDSTFIYTLATTGIVPEHAYSNTYKENPIGSGPYQLVQWEKGQQIIVKANPNYYRKQPYFQKLTFLFLSEDAAFAAAKAGQVDVVSVPAASGESKIEGMRLIQLKSVDNRGVMLPYVVSSGETEDHFPIGNDVTADIAIRKAMNMAIDRQLLVDGILNGFGTPAYSVADGLPWWNEVTVIEDNRVEEAKFTLEKAGWKLQDNGIRAKDGIEASISLVYPAGDQIRQSLSLAFAEMVEPLGVKVTPKGKSWNEIEKVMYSQPVMMGWGSHSPLEMYHLYSSSTKGIGYYNANYYSNANVDNYMNKALRTTSQGEAMKWWKKAQWDGETGFSAKGDAPWIWLVNVDHLYFVNEKLDIGKQKIQPHGHGWPITDFISDWHWKE
ncbi:Oligopeptide-binding protein AppA precursor [Paraliobacillus sp. PM-2]|uniref:ABC transporter substrate-binding protein n=1 Tax=Paraliobacillus sp. PM-2 TaxID=1462524 RepID=UPI00061BC620|nr:ABC transporter substrate-binding protein [Paraliobacillus sp. PM-2]CQR47403.1 Oligopeptide-binding protein AppA precursor [Paraliobacillus sp. PM-2]